MGGRRERRCSSMEECIVANHSVFDIVGLILKMGLCSLYLRVSRHTMLQTKALKDKIAKQLTGGLIQSFSHDGELVERINVFFLKFDTWLHITVSEGTAIVKDIGSENPLENNVEFEVDGQNFQYVITEANKVFPELKPLLGATLEGFNELVWRKDESYSCGFKLTFSNGNTLVVQTDDDDKMSVNTVDKLLPHVIEK